MNRACQYCRALSGEPHKPDCEEKAVRATGGEWLVGFKSRDKHVEKAEREIERLRAYAELITAPARELLELYDLRPKLAEMEACDMAAWGKLQSDTKAALRQYGERKKAGWIALRAALGARVTASEILEKNAEASRPETNCYSCPSCAGDATGAMRDDVVEYGDPPVRLPYRCLVVTCAKCGSFTGADGEDARQAAVDAHLDSLHQSCTQPGYVHEVPDRCDRIVWRGYYYHLPETPTSEFQVNHQPPSKCSRCGYSPVLCSACGEPHICRGTKEANYRAALEAINRLVPAFATLDNARSIAGDALGLDSQSVACTKQEGGGFVAGLRRAAELCFSTPYACSEPVRMSARDGTRRAIHASILRAIDECGAGKEP